MRGGIYHVDLIYTGDYESFFEGFLALFFWLHDSLVAMFVGRLARVMVYVIRWILATNLDICARRGCVNG